MEQWELIGSLGTSCLVIVDLISCFLCVSLGSLVAEMEQGFALADGTASSTSPSGKKKKKKTGKSRFIEVIRAWFASIHRNCC